MTSRVEDGKKSSDSKNGKLLCEIETINKALYTERNPSRSSVSSASTRGKSIARNDRLDSISKSKQNVGVASGSVNNDSMLKDKKSIWNWKPLKALSHAKSKRFSCCFTLQIHTIEGLPSSFNGDAMFLHWKRRDGELVAGPARVIEGVAEFEEQLAHTCPVHGSRSGPHHSAKYEAKHSLLYASLGGNLDLDLGKHRVDLTRLLPLTFEELEEEKSSGKWTTTYKLQGKAAGAIINVSFGYTVLGDNLSLPHNAKNVLGPSNSKQNSAKVVRSTVKGSNDGGRGAIHPSRSLPKDKRPGSASQPTEDIKVLHEVFPAAKSDLSHSLTMLDKMFSEEIVDPSKNHGSDIDISVDQSDPAQSSLCRMNSCKENVVWGSSDFSSAEMVKEHLKKESLHGEEAAKFVDHSPRENHDSSVIFSNNVTSLEGEASYEIRRSTDENSEEPAIRDGNSVDKEACTKESILEELEFVLNNVADLDKAGLYTPVAKSEMGSSENFVVGESNGVGTAHGLEDLEYDEDEFLSLLGVEDSPIDLSFEGEPESPRERLLREFEREAEASGYSLFGLDFDEDEEGYAYDAPKVPDFGEDENEYDYIAPRVSEWDGVTEASPLPPTIELGEEYYFASRVDDGDGSNVSRWGNCAVPQASRISEGHQHVCEESDWRPRAMVMEDLETEALLREWGMDKKTFESSPRDSAADFGSTVDLPHQETPVLPALGEGLGPFVQTENGGFLRSMSPALFRNSKNGGSLIMQVSSPVVVPAEMGSGTMEMLENLGSLGMEKLSVQAKKLMPLEDITGKTIQQIAWDGERLEAPQRQDLIQHGLDPSPVSSGGHKKSKRQSTRPRSGKNNSSTQSNMMSSEYVSLEDLAPLAMDKIEALSIEGLKIQSGMSEEEAPSTIRPKSLGVEGAVGLQLLDIQDNSDTVDGLMGLSVTLDEWMKLDSGELGEDEMNERTSKILAAHHASCTDLAFLGRKGDGKKSKRPAGKCGLFGNNFTVALMVQLRDPLRDYEPVGTPMLALIQVERVFVPPKQKIYSSIAEVKKNNEDDDDPETNTQSETKEDKREEKVSKEDLIPQYKVAEVHVAGLKDEPGTTKKKLWGTATQLRSGSRWLLANGMGKGGKQPFSKSKDAGRSSQGTVFANTGDTLWSISARIHGTGAKWKELAALNPHIRNPNVMIPNGTAIKLK